MKILASSKSLAKKLSEIDFNNDSVYSVSLNRIQDGNYTTCELSIHTTKYSVKINVQAIIFESFVIQEHRSWDLVMGLLNKVDEYPVVLDIQKNVISVIFQY